MSGKQVAFIMACKTGYIGGRAKSPEAILLQTHQTAFLMLYGT
jgi:hypothetical protein